MGRKFDERVWAVESANGLGYLLAQQLVAAGERVVDVPPASAARTRVLGSARSQKNDPNDARSVAVTALRQPSLQVVRCDDHAKVLKLTAKRHRDLARLRNQAACCVHALLLELHPGGLPGEYLMSRAVSKYPISRHSVLGTRGYAGALSLKVSALVRVLSAVVLRLFAAVERFSGESFLFPDQLDVYEL